MSALYRALRGKLATIISAAPLATGSENSITTAFNGDQSKSVQPVSHQISGAATLGQPATGYVYTHEAYPRYLYMLNQSGWNQQTAGNDGRTGACAYRTKVDNYGQGDAVAYNASVFVTGTKAGATHWLANPAGVLFNGDMTAGQAGVYLNPYETALNDGGYDVAATGVVNNFSRSNATGALSTVWNGYRAQSIGSARCDAIISATGPWQSGIDFAMSSLDFGANRAAVSLKANQRIYLNNAANASGNLGADWRSTVFNGDWIGYDTSINGTIIAAGGNPVVQVTSTQALITQALKHSGNALGFFNTTPVGQPGAVTTTSGFTANAGTAMNSASTSTGGTGTSAYTFGDVVRALKLLGVIAS